MFACRKANITNQGSTCSYVFIPLIWTRVAESNDKQSWINVGRSFERVALKATSLNIKHAHMNMPCEEIEIRTKLQKHLGLKDEQPLLLLRMGYSNPRPKSYRRPVEEVMV